MVILKFIVFRLDSFEGDHIPVSVQIIWLHPFDSLAGKQLASEFLSKIRFFFTKYSNPNNFSKVK